ncbi:MAG TPA: hypothetical protein VK153_00275 [Candidatus Paceibacterota bacterium]|nr:hypothetical protein [Candidatus Paceibacterota bacterium]
MEKIKMFFAHKFFRVLKWAFLVLLIAFFVLVGFRMSYLKKMDKINAQVEKIHNARITMDDVMGKYIPPDPGDEADKTIEGVDVNKNGIRDDVELAIFKKYPNSAKTRAVLLQYAFWMQMEFTQPMLSTEIVTEVATELGRADTCVADTLMPRKNPESFRTNAEVNKIQEYIDFIEDRQVNNESRKILEESFYVYLRSFGDSDNKICDINLATLPN